MGLVHDHMCQTVCYSFHTPEGTRLSFAGQMSYIPGIWDPVWSKGQVRFAFCSQHADAAENKMSYVIPTPDALGYMAVSALQFPRAP